MSSLVARLRKLARDCGACRSGFCCGRCLCCMPEEQVVQIVREAQAEDATAPRAAPAPRDPNAPYQNCADMAAHGTCRHDPNCGD